jgi:polyhydroxyalkanoate synthesis regulator phasin
MANKLRAFEIEALSSELLQKIIIHNENLILSTQDKIEKIVEKQEPRIKELKKLEEEIDKINKYKAELRGTLQEDYNIKSSYRVVDDIILKITKEIHEKEGKITTNQQQIKNDIILTNSTDLQEILTQLLKKYNL